MAIRISWDKYEVAIILAAGVKVIRKELHRNDAISQVSKILRHKAVIQGVEIDSIFRNENGISMQISKIIALLNGKESGLARTKLFNELTELYFSDFNSFFKILTEAKDIVNISNYCNNTFLENINNLAPPVLKEDKCLPKHTWEYEDIALIIDLYIFGQIHSDDEYLLEIQKTSEFLKMRIQNKGINSNIKFIDVIDITQIIHHIGDYYKHGSISESILDFKETLDTAKNNLVKVLLDASEIKINLKYGQG